MRIYVNQKDIDEARILCRQGLPRVEICPIALALHRKTKKSYRVGYTYVTYRNKKIYELTEVSLDFINNFDIFNIAKPQHVSLKEIE